MIQEILHWLRETASSITGDKESVVGAAFEFAAKGGWAMSVLGVISLFIFVVGFGVLFRLRAKGGRGMREEIWRSWIVDAGEREGAVGEMFDSVSDVIGHGGGATVEDAFEDIRIRELRPFDRDLRLMNTAVGASPLVGLLGTVTGMLSTFAGLAGGSGGEKTIDMVAAGISEALYTTETGLLVALPGMFFHYYLSRRFARLQSFVDHVEVVWSQQAQKDVVRDERREVEQLVQSIARQEIGKRIQSRLTGATA